MSPRVLRWGGHLSCKLMWTCLNNLKGSELCKAETVDATETGSEHICPLYNNHTVASSHAAMSSESPLLSRTVDDWDV